MALDDDAAKNATLDDTLAGWYGRWSLEFALFTDDPANGGVELDSAGGYAAVSSSLGDWINPTTGTVATTVSAVSFGTSTDQWTAGGDPATATWWRLRAVGGSVNVYKAPLDSEINVGSSGVGVTFQPSIPVK